MSCRRTGYGPTTCTTRSSRSSTSDPFWSCGPTTESASVTALVRVEGVAFGLVANSSHHLGGAIDAEAADKMADFLTLCESARAADHLAMRYAGLHGRPGCRSRRRRPAVQPDVHRRGTADGAVRDGHPAQGLRAGRDGDGRRLFSRPGVHRCLADRGDRRHGSRGRRPAGVQQGIGRRRRPGRAAESVRQTGRGRLSARQGTHLGHHLRTRRRDRPGRHPGHGLSGCCSTKKGIGRESCRQSRYRHRRR